MSVVNVSRASRIQADQMFHRITRLVQYDSDTAISLGSIPTEVWFFLQKGIVDSTDNGAGNPKGKFFESN